MVTFKDNFEKNGAEFGTMIKFKKTENVEFHTQAKFLDLTDNIKV
jgi:hypothetical protein